MRHVSAIVKTARNAREEWLCIGAVLCLATALYFYRLGAESLWIDELYSIYDARHLSVITLLTDNSRPLYYLLLKVWLLFGNSEFWLRALNIPFGLGSVYLTYRLGMRVAGRFVGLTAALLLCLSPVFIDHTQEVRMYVLSVLFGTAGALVLTESLEKPVQSRIATWAVLRVLAIVTLPLNLWLLAVDLLLIWLNHLRDRRVLLTYAKWFAVIAVSCLPALIHTCTHAPEAITYGWVSHLEKPNIESVCKRLIEFVCGTAISEHKRFWIPFCLLSLALVANNLADLRTNKKLRYVAAWALGPVLIAIVVSFVSGSIWNVPRYQLLIVPYLFIILANGFFRCVQRQKYIAVGVAIAYLIGIGGGLRHYYYDNNRQNWRGIFSIIKEREKAGDIVVMCNHISRCQFAVEHYYKGSAPILVGWHHSSRTSPSLASCHHCQPRYWVIYDGSETERNHFRDTVGRRWQVETVLDPGKRGLDLELFLVSERTEKRGQSGL